MFPRWLRASLTMMVLAGALAAARGEQPAPRPTCFEKEGIKARVASWRQTQAWIARQQNKIVVLDAWSTYCEPCLREFPQLVALQERYPRRVVCISFNLNYTGTTGSTPESAGEDVLAELVKQKARLHNVVSSTPDEAFYEKVDLASIPAVFVYGPDGKLRQRFDNDEMKYGANGFTYKRQVVPLVEQLLKRLPVPAR